MFAPEVNNSVNVCVKSYIVENIFAIVQHGFFATSDQPHKSVSTLIDALVQDGLTLFRGVRIAT